MQEYEHLQALKSRKYFNQQAYKQLEQRVTDFCWSKSDEDPEFKEIVYDCIDGFKYATKGLSQKKANTGEGSFEGWMDLSGRMNGVGVCYLNNGYKYIGNWENNQYSGTGILSTYYRKELAPEKQPPYSEYSGNFKKSKFNGEGRYKDDNTIYEGTFVYDKYEGKGKIVNYFDITIDDKTYENTKEYEGDFVNDKYEGTGKLTDVNGDVFEGKWKNGHLVQGTAKYSNGDTYTGTFKYIKKKNAQLESEAMLPHGEGVMKRADGDEQSGKWNNGQYIVKKQKENKNKK
jgi:hypothetical protein